MKTLCCIKVDVLYEWEVWASWIEGYFPHKVVWREGQAPSGYKPSILPGYICFEGGWIKDDTITLYLSEDEKNQLIDDPQKLFVLLEEHFNGTVKEEKEDHTGMIQRYDGSWGWL